MAHHDGSIRISIGGHPQVKQGKIHAKGQNRRSQHEQQQPEKDPPQFISKVEYPLAHDARL